VSVIAKTGKMPVLKEQLKEMDMKKGMMVLAGVLGTLVMAPAAMAHPGHAGETGLVAGMMHPLLGYDHLIAALAVGFWAIRLGGNSRWLIPLVFVGGLSAAVVAPQAVSTTAAEAGIVASLFVLGLLAIFSLRLPIALGIAMTAMFAVFHGTAHASEIPQTVSTLAYAIGLTVTTTFVCAAGAALATWLPAPRRLATAAA
jgi:urease accessory protein